MKWIDWANKIQAISQAGLEYSKDVFDIERFEQLRELSVEIVCNYTGVEQETVQLLFANEKGYATPKVVVRGVVFKEEKILLVKETTDGAWALPGGWADIGLSPYENVVKEILEETGYIVEPVNFLGIMDRRMHDNPPSIYHEYILYILCEIKGGETKVSIETTDAEFFSKDNLPNLSTSRNTYNQILKIFEVVKSPDKGIFCD